MTLTYCFNDDEFSVWLMMMAVVISVPRTVADNLDQSDDSSGPAPIDYSEKRSLPISIPDYHTVQHAGERYVVCISFTSVFKKNSTASFCLISLLLFTTECMSRLLDSAACLALFLTFMNLS